MLYREHEIKSEALTAEREKSLFVRAQAGDMEAVNEIAACYLLFARKQAGQAAAGTLSDDDVMSCAHDGLMRAMRSYDPHRGVRFYGYAHRVIYGETKKKIAQEARQTETKRNFTEHVQTHPHYARDYEIDFSRADTVATVQRLLVEGEALLTKEQQKVVALRLQGLTLQKIGDCMKGVTRQRIEQVLKAALAKLRPAFVEAFK